MSDMFADEHEAWIKALYDKDKVIDLLEADVKQLTYDLDRIRAALNDKGLIGRYAPDSHDVSGDKVCWCSVCRYVDALRERINNTK